MGEPQIPFTRAQARAAGLTNHQVDAQLAAGTWLAVRRGILYPVPESGTDLVAPHLDIPVAVRAALLASPNRDLVVSHATAAQLLGLPRPLAGWPQPHFTATSGPTRRRGGVQIRVAALPTVEVVEYQGIYLTSPDRTVADCLRTLPGRDGLAILDAALHRHLVTTASVASALQAQAGWPGVAIARQVLALADQRRESPLESWSAWAFAHTGVPTPEWQVEIYEPDTGIFIARGDCWWPGGVIGEADGRSKYALAAAERGGGGKAVFEVLQAERRGGKTQGGVEKPPVI